MRLIDADALGYEVLEEYGADGGNNDVNVIYGMIINAPTVDAVEVVCCKDCAYLNIQNTKYLYAICERHGIEFKPFEDDTRTHFCAWGVMADRKSVPQTERENNEID